MSDDEPEEEHAAAAEDATVEEETAAEDVAEEPPAEAYEDIDPEEDLPLSALRDRVEAERARNDDESQFSQAAESESAADADSSELFEEVDVGDIDGEAVWDAVVEGEADPEELLGEEPRTESDAEPAVEPTETPDEHVIDKREYCQRCEFFSEPPDATCENDGTEIVELVDNGHFRVRGCPKVAADDEALSGFAREE